MASTRLEIRLAAQVRARVEHAAMLQRERVSEFVRHAIDERAETVIGEAESRTVVPSEYIEALLSALDEPPEPNPATARAAARLERLRA